MQRRESEPGRKDRRDTDLLEPPGLVVLRPEHLCGLPRSHSHTQWILPNLRHSTRRRTQGSQRRKRKRGCGGGLGLGCGTGGDNGPEEISG